MRDYYIFALHDNLIRSKLMLGHVMRSVDAVCIVFARSSPVTYWPKHDVLSRLVESRVTRIARRASHM